jgi:hypothetical protein
LLFLSDELHKNSRYPFLLTSSWSFIESFLDRFYYSAAFQNSTWYVLHAMICFDVNRPNP